MATVTIPKNKYEMLEKRASLYDKMLRFLPEQKWGIENYSKFRINDFMKQDKISKKLQSQAKKFLASLG